MHNCVTYRCAGGSAVPPDQQKQQQRWWAACDLFDSSSIWTSCCGSLELSMLHLAGTALQRIASASLQQHEVNMLTWGSTMTSAPSADLPSPRSYLVSHFLSLYWKSVSFTNALFGFPLPCLRFQIQHQSIDTFAFHRPSRPNDLSLPSLVRSSNIRHGPSFWSCPSCSLQSSSSTSHFLIHSASISKPYSFLCYLKTEKDAEL